MLDFIKMHGFGNDFIIIDNRKKDYELNLPNLASKICNRKFSIGADGLIILENSDIADLKWRIFNPDGTIVQEKCGNGLSCIARYFFNNIEKKRFLKIESKLGIIEVEVNEEATKINMGKLNFHDEINKKMEIFLDKKIVEGYFIVLGNPHFVFFVDVLNEDLFYRLAPLLEKNEIFPEGANIHMAQIKDEYNISMLNWERNIGPTLSCGSGACSVVIAALEKLKKLSTNSISVSSLAGTYSIKLEKGDIYMISNAVESFRGYINI